MRSNFDATEKLLGAGIELCAVKLPTVSDVLRCCSLKRKQMKHSIVEPKWSKIRELVLEEVFRIWVKASVPTVSIARARAMLDKYHDTVNDLRKASVKYKKSVNFEKKEEQFHTTCAKLFDIAACKCKKDSCNCSVYKKIPKVETKFVQDQRTLRKMEIGGLDRNQARHTKIFPRSTPKPAPFVSQLSTSKSTPISLTGWPPLFQNQYPGDIQDKINIQEV